MPLRAFSSRRERGRWVIALASAVRRMRVRSWAVAGSHPSAYALRGRSRPRFQGFRPPGCVMYRPGNQKGGALKLRLAAEFGWITVGA